MKTIVMIIYACMANFKVRGNTWQNVIVFENPLLLTGGTTCWNDGSYDCAESDRANFFIGLLELSISIELLSINIIGF